MSSASYFFFMAAASFSFPGLPFAVLRVIWDFLSIKAVDVGLNLFTLLERSWMLSI
jgi:hypothetical protein